MCFVVVMRSAEPSESLACPGRPGRERQWDDQVHVHWRVLGTLAGRRKDRSV